VSRTLPLRAEAGEGGRVLLRAPLIGIWCGQPAAGQLVGPGSPAGTMRRLAEEIMLVVPEGVAGTVEIVAVRDLAAAVGYGDVLFAVNATAVATTHEKATSSRTKAHLVVAPTDGVFYRSPSPGAAAFVGPGDRVAAGQAIGLIEVMKTFSPIVYGGGALPENAEVVALLARDGEEVRAGQPLVEVK
jgi:pyruvate carboxylase